MRQLCARGGRTTVRNRSDWRPSDLQQGVDLPGGIRLLAADLKDASRYGESHELEVVAAKSAALFEVLRGEELLFCVPTLQNKLYPIRCTLLQRI